MKVFCKKDPRGKPPSKETKLLKKQLKEFYNSHYKQLMAKNEVFCYIICQNAL